MSSSSRRASMSAVPRSCTTCGRAHNNGVRHYVKANSHLAQISHIAWQAKSVRLCSLSSIRTALS